MTSLACKNPFCTSLQASALSRSCLARIGAKMALSLEAAIGSTQTSDGRTRETQTAATAVCHSKPHPQGDSASQANGKWRLAQSCGSLSSQSVSLGGHRWLNSQLCQGQQ